MKTQSILTLRKAFVFKIDETYRGVSNIAVPFLIIYYLIFFKDICHYLLLIRIHNKTHYFKGTKAEKVLRLLHCSKLFIL